MKNVSLRKILSIFLIIVCFYSCNNNDDFNNQATISGKAVDDPISGGKVTLFDTYGNELSSTITDENGAFSFTIDEARISDGYELLIKDGTINGNIFDNELRSQYKLSEVGNNSNITILTTLIYQISLQSTENDIFSKRDQAIDQLVNIGVIEDIDEWSHIEPSSLNLDKIRQIINIKGFNNWLQATANEVISSDISVENMECFPKSHGGIVNISLENNSTNEISAFKGDIIEERLLLKALYEPKDYTFITINCPDGLIVNYDDQELPLIKYQIPQDIENDNIQFNIEVINKQSNSGRPFSGKINIIEETVIGNAQIYTNGGYVSDEWEDIVVEFNEMNLDEKVGVKISKGITNEGNTKIRFKFDRDIQNEDGKVKITIPNPNLLNQSNQRKKNARSKDIKTSTKNQTGYPLIHLWKTNKATFIDNGKHRFSGNSDINIRQFFLTCGLNIIGADACFEIKTSSELYSAYSIYDTIDWDHSEPVLFVHGYTLGDSLGGGEGTWKQFPNRIMDLDINGVKFIPFEFRWRTNARFQDASLDLFSALTLIWSKSKKKVHLIAHSFGGVLCRVLLQDIDTPVNGGSRYVASLTTLGTPHSGISDYDYKVMHDTTFMKGQDGIDLFEACGQITCHQMGEDIFLGSINSLERLDFSGLLSVSQYEGKIASDLSKTSTYKLPDQLPITVGIGLTIDRGVLDLLVNTVDNGDALITYAGQRFHPELTNTGSLDALLEDNDNYGANITEKLLGIDRDIHPGDNLTINEWIQFGGYKHSQSVISLSTNTNAALQSQLLGIPNEPGVDCAINNTCRHASYKLVETALTRFLGTTQTENLSFHVNFQVLDSASLDPVNQATIEVLLADRTVGEGKTNSEGNITIELPFFPQSTYTALVYAEGYHSSMYNNNFSTLLTPETSSVDFPRILIEPDNPAKGVLAGYIIDAVDSSSIEEATYILYKNSRVVTEGVTDANGYYMINDLIRGMYNLQLTKTGYREGNFIFYVQPETTNAGNASMRRLLLQSQMSIRLEWNVDPDDLDSHLHKYDSDENLLYHIYFSQKNDSSSGDNLDRDDTTSYGPETITIQNVDYNCHYIYSVFHYSGVGSITSTSNARVQIEYSDQNPIILSAPTNGSGKWWNVFEIVNGEIIPCQSNCISD